MSGDDQPDLQVTISYDGTRMPYSGEGPMAGILRCPRCGGQHLHHRDVTIVNRACEDGPGYALRVKPPVSGIEYFWDGASAVPDTELTQRAKEDIPYRRNHLTLEFSCEDCARSTQGKGPRKATLEIAQHKGRTFMRWILEENPTVGVNIYTGRPTQP